MRDAQLALHRTRVAYEQYAKTLPWSAEPLPGYDQVARNRAELLELSFAVITHPYWAQLGEGVVAARMALKHAQEAQLAGEAG
nr:MULTISPECIES: hypothetical protein [unclassified Streptomyces]